ncbi:helix-turn-helix domain-containing protein [Streptomyces sp. ME02-6979-3A]|uniref:helix-turn-helix domain-containing protein n=1 Tax=Streptomyces sp. ME02-6979-3A TaxID=3028673 RepID=UPI0029A93CAC|nr:helix-turn-helix domain-containing protein [Streptomyces sp. ME02-6979-3A]MDX3329735.1 helix-turn-helix domain-containing protein [Streptomyces sp. ME02-6979-3A]
MNRLCQIDGCDKPARAQRTLCQTHRARIRRYGDPHFTQWGTADVMDVELIVQERRPASSLTRLERVLVAQGLTERGESASEIARIVGVSQRTVERWRSRSLEAA